jgi:hypothetical protein
LCAIYRLSEWRKVAVLVTAFTIGHSLTLSLAALQIVTPQYNIVEKLIPLTIMATAIYNVWRNKTSDTDGISRSSREGETFSKPLSINYLFALIFGLIHGLGFSNYFRELLGAESEIIAPLFAFNVGIEAGQLSIVAVILMVSFCAFNIFKISQQAWTQFISGAAFGIAVTLL